MLCTQVSFRHIPAPQACRVTSLRDPLVLHLSQSWQQQRGVRLCSGLRFYCYMLPQPMNTLSDCYAVHCLAVSFLCTSHTLVCTSQDQQHTSITCPSHQSNQECDGPACLRTVCNHSASWHLHARISPNGSHALGDDCRNPARSGGPSNPQQKREGVRRQLRKGLISRAARVGIKLQRQADLHRAQTMLQT